LTVFPIDCHRVSKVASILNSPEPRVNIRLPSRRSLVKCPVEAFPLLLDSPIPVCRLDWPILERTLLKRKGSTEGKGLAVFQIAGFLAWVGG
jgi:hypothetical protein